MKPSFFFNGEVVVQTFSAGCWQLLQGRVAWGAQRCRFCVVNVWRDASLAGGDHLLE